MSHETIDEFFDEPTLKAGSLLLLDGAEHQLIIGHTGKMFALVNTSTSLTHNYRTGVTHGVYSSGITRRMLEDVTYSCEDVFIVVND